MATANTIESFFALINPSGKLSARPALVGDQTGGAPVSAQLRVLRGATLRLPAGSHVAVLTGRLWLTHRGDWRDHFPHGGDSFDTSAESDSVIQALTDATLLIH